MGCFYCIFLAFCVIPYQLSCSGICVVRGVVASVVVVLIIFIFLYLLIASFYSFLLFCSVKFGDHRTEKPTMSNATNLILHIILWIYNKMKQKLNSSSTSHCMKLFFFLMFENYTKVNFDVILKK